MPTAATNVLIATAGVKITRSDDMRAVHSSEAPGSPNNRIEHI
jgi:hypothetical protein